jgi:hypothetical protein
MKRSIIFASGALQVALIQFVSSAILITFLHQMLVNSDDPILMLIILLRVTPDRDSFELIQELLQFSLFIPVMLYICLKLIRTIDVEYAYLIIRHQFRKKWSLQTYLYILMLCCESAIVAMITMIVYIKICINITFDIPWIDFFALTISITMGLVFFITLTAFLTLNNPIIMMMFILVISLAIGKILIHIIPAASLSIAAALYLNHLFVPLSEPRMVLFDHTKIVALITIDLIVIGILDLLIYYKIKKTDFIGRRS